MFQIIGMVVVGLVVLGIIQGVVDAIRGKDSGDELAGATQLNPVEHGFRGRVRQDTERLEDGTELDVFDFQIKGVIVGDHEMWNGIVRVGVLDVTESKEGAFPVLCAIDALQRPETCIFEYASAPQHFGEVAFLERWVTLFRVPIEALQFAKKGRRKLCFCFGVCPATGENDLHTYDEVEMEFDVREPGYVDLDRIQQKMDKLTVQLAVLVSKVDGVLDPTEGEVVQQWIKKRLSVEMDAQRVHEMKRELNQAMVEAGSFKGDAASVQTICEQIVQQGVHAHRYDALELCLEVAGADGTAEQQELEIIEEIAKSLEVDAGRFKDMVQKALPVGMFSEKNPDSVLGISESMSADEIRMLLGEEFRKWNSRVSHSDKKVREQASEMLTLIADARKRHIG